MHTGALRMQKCEISNDHYSLPFGLSPALTFQNLLMTRTQASPYFWELENMNLLVLMNICPEAIFVLSAATLLGLSSCLFLSYYYDFIL